MRRAAAIDANQPDVVRDLRRAGVTVQPLHSVGKGCPDLLCGFRGQNYLFELKDPTASNRDRQLRASQVAWFSAWNGTAHKVETAEAALLIMTQNPNKTTGKDVE